MNVFLQHAGQPEACALADMANVPSGRRLPKQISGNEILYIFRWLDGAERNGGSTELDAPVPPGARLLQPAEAMRRALDRQARREAWVRNGVNVYAGGGSAGPGTGTGIQRRIVIPVFQLEALGVFSHGGASGPIGRTPLGSGLATWEGEQPSRSAVVRRAEREAVKAVYALGLDYGAVTMVSDPSGVPAVEDISPFPPREEAILERFAQALQRFQDGLKADRQRQEPVMLGMDPEFVLRRPGPNGKVVLASKFLEPKGAVGCDSVRFGDRLLYPLAELRPAPSAEPGELFRNLYAAMKLASERISDASLEWLAGGMPAKGLALGGHIHVSGAWLHSDLLRAMDNYMALPLMLLEDSTSRARRPRYGALGDFRRQFHGGFEYRTLPSWIVSPVLAMGVVSLAKIICDHWHELARRPLEKPEIQSAFYKGDKELLKPIAMLMWQDLEKTEGYVRYRRYLNKIKGLIVHSQPWNEQQDVRISWKLPPYRV